MSAPDKALSRLHEVEILLHGSCNGEQVRAAEVPAEGTVGVERPELGGGDEPHAVSGLDEPDELLEIREGLFRFRCGTHARRFPLGGWRIGAAPEVDRVPELRLHPLVRVVIDADGPAAASGQRRVHLVERGLALGQLEPLLSAIRTSVERIRKMLSMPL